MGKITRVTPEEARAYAKKHKKELDAAYKRAKPFDDGFADTDTRPIARGFAQFREYINRAGRPKSANRKAKISIRLPEAAVNQLRKVGGYSTILGDYIMVGIKSGAIRLPKQV